MLNLSGSYDLSVHIFLRILANTDFETYAAPSTRSLCIKKIVDIYDMISTIKLLNFLKLTNELNNAEIKQILFATNMKKTSILQNFSNYTPSIPYKFNISGL